jgi:outer membrane protein assembly factor BamB
MDHALIDLGERAEAGPQAPPRRRPDWPRRNRRLASIAVVLLAAATLTASRHLPQFVEVATLGVGPDGRAEFLVDQGALYLRFESPIYDGEVERYGLADGRPGWRIMAEGNQRFSGTVMLAGALLVLSGVCPSLRDAQTIAVDRDTGRVRWTHPGRPVGAVAGANLLVVEERPDEERCGEPPRDPVEVSQGIPAFAAAPVEVLDAATGAARWSFTPVPGSQVWYRTDSSGAIRRIVTAESSGAALVRDAASGRVTATGRVPGVPAVPVSPAAGVVRDVVLVPRDQGTALMMTAYSAETLTRLWSTPVTTHPIEDVDVTNSYVPCDRYLCVQTSRELLAVNPANGSTGWRLPWARMVAGGPRWILVVSGPDVESPERGLYLVDARTGWPGPALLRYQVLGERVDAPGVVVLGSVGLGDTLFTMLDLTSGQRWAVGRARGRYDWCQATARFLACREGLRTVRIWRLVGDQA